MPDARRREAFDEAEVHGLIVAWEEGRGAHGEVR